MNLTVDQIAARNEQARRTRLLKRAMKEAGHEQARRSYAEDGVVCGTCSAVYDYNDDGTMPHIWHCGVHQKRRKTPWIIGGRGGYNNPMSTADEIMPQLQGDSGEIPQEPMEADPTHDHDEDALDDAADKMHVTEGYAPNSQLGGASRESEVPENARPGDAEQEKAIAEDPANKPTT